MQTKQFTVLIIDDSDVIRERFAEMLREIAGIQDVRNATCAKEGLEMTHSLNPDFVILDINMPDMSGIDILKKIKKNKPSPVVAVLTNYPYPAYRTCCMDRGADYFFDKSSEFLEVKKIAIGLLNNFD